MLNVGVNSWVTLIEANEYFSTKWGAASTWAALTDNEKESLLITAYNQLKGKANLDLPDTTEDVKLKQAQYEYSWYLYNNSDSKEKREALISQGVTEFKTLDFQEKYGTLADLPPEVENLLDDYILNQGGAFVEVNRTGQNVCR